MSTVITVLSIVLIVITVLAVLVALAAAIGAIFPFFKRTAHERQPAVLLDADLIFDDANEDLSAGAGWDRAIPAFVTLARLTTRDFEAGLALYAPEAS